MNKVTLWNVSSYSLVGINILEKCPASKVKMGAYENGVILFLKKALIFLANYRVYRSERTYVFCLFFQRKIDEYFLDFYLMCIYLVLHTTII
jgi:hypothetical protein